MSDVRRAGGGAPRPASGIHGAPTCRGRRDKSACGNPELGLKDIDASPTKSRTNELGEKDRDWEAAFDKRPPVDLFALAKDPGCVHNLAHDQMHAPNAIALREKLVTELKNQNDPPVLGIGEVFDHYDSPKANTTKKQQAKCARKREVECETTRSRAENQGRRGNRSGSRASRAGSRSRACGCG